MKYSENIMKHAEAVIRETNFRNNASVDTAIRSISWDIKSLLECESIDYDALFKLNQIYSGLENFKTGRKL